MALTDKLTAIGAAIREKTGSTDLLRLDEMPGAIAAIETGGGVVDDIALSLINGTITEIKIPDSITVLPGYTFYNKQELIKVDLNNVYKIGSACFQDCKKLEEIDTSKIKYFDGGNIFMSSKIKVLDFSSILNIGISSVGTARTLQQMQYLEEVRNFHPVKLEQYLFYGCPKLKTIDLSELTETGTGSLNGCNALENIILPKIQKIGENCFAFSSASYANQNRTLIDIGPDCVEIKAQAFRYSKHVTTVIVRATTPPTLANVNAFDFLPTTSGDHGIYIYVPKDSLQAYWNATNWSSFVGSGLTYRAIEDYPEITGG